MFKNKTILSHTILSLFISQLIFWMVFLNFETLPPQIPIWYLQQWGAPQLAPRSLAWLLPGLAAGILSINLITISLIHRKWQFLAGLLISSGTIINLFFLLATFNLLNRTLGLF